MCIAKALLTVCIFAPTLVVLGWLLCTIYNDRVNHDK